MKVEYTPVWAPGDGGYKANVREKDGIIFDAIKGIVHLTQWQSVKLELELHLTQRQYRKAYSAVNPPNLSMSIYREAIQCNQSDKIPKRFC